MRKRPVLRGLHSASLCDFYEYAASVTTIARQAFYLGAVALPAVPCYDVRDHHVVALRQIVLCGLPDESPRPLGELDDARNRRGRPLGRNRGLAGISRTLLTTLRGGSSGSAVSMVTMAPRVAPVPHGRVTLRGCFIVSSGLRLCGLALAPVKWL